MTIRLRLKLWWNNQWTFAEHWPRYWRWLYPFEFRLRWWLACRRNKKDPDACWGRMAIWAMWRGPWEDWFGDSWQVQEGCSYCGKCQKESE